MNEDEFTLPSHSNDMSADVAYSTSSPVEVVNTPNEIGYGFDEIEEFDMLSGLRSRLPDLELPEGLKAQMADVERRYEEFSRILDEPDPVDEGDMILSLNADDLPEGYRRQPNESRPIYDHNKSKEDNLKQFSSDAVDYGSILQYGKHHDYFHIIPLDSNPEISTTPQAIPDVGKE